MKKYLLFFFASLLLVDCGPKGPREHFINDDLSFLFNDEYFLEDLEEEDGAFHFFITKSSKPNDCYIEATATRLDDDFLEDVTVGELHSYMKGDIEAAFLFFNDNEKYELEDPEYFDGSDLGDEDIVLDGVDYRGTKNGSPFWGSAVSVMVIDYNVLGTLSATSLEEIRELESIFYSIDHK